MIEVSYFIGVTFFVCTLLRYGYLQEDPSETSVQELTTVSCSEVWLTHSNSIKNYGILELKISDQWYALCDDIFELQNTFPFQNAAKVACIELGFNDGRFQPGSMIQTPPGVSMNVTPIYIYCHGNETALSQCSIKKKAACQSNSHTTIYCSNKSIETQAKMDIRIVSNKSYGTIEANLYGFWGPICAIQWTNLEANAACRYLGYTGGTTYYGKSNSENPMVLGHFNCFDQRQAFSECSYKGITENLGCTNQKPAAGVLCYNREDGVRFRLTDRWHGKVEVMYEKTLGRVCNTNWTDANAQVVCRQLGYKDGRMGIKSHQVGVSRALMDNVNCTGSESSILECNHDGYWELHNAICNEDATVTCNITICGPKDIRNAVSNLATLTHCTIIEGSLSILLIDSARPEDYQLYSFPNLVEITEYLLLFRANGLRSLRNLFPNLAVIRGDELFHNYALVAFEMEDLVEIGLPSLVSIRRGAVRLQKNPQLCYINTIDWVKLTGVSSEPNYFKENKAPGECVDKCPDNCSKCWTIHDCQRNVVCDVELCKSGMCDNGNCCDSNCIGGCTGEGSTRCTACKDMMEQHNGVLRCVDRCSPSTYEYLKHRCLLDFECLNFSHYPIMTPKLTPLSLKLVPKEREHGFCMAECPSGYNVDETNSHLCVKCEGKCPKFCQGMEIDNVNAVQAIGDCNIIQGPLVIKLMAGNQIGKEFEKNFAQIEEVTDFIKISLSSPLVSLHFLKGLKVIGGKNLEHNKYALYVFDNINLEELFLDEVAHNLSIKNGTVFFQSNPKLCYNKIVDFVEAVGMDLKKMNPEDVSKDTNGHQTPCLTQELIYHAVKVSPHIAFLNWTKINITDERQLIGYVMHWKVAPHKNVSIYKGRDACSSDQWFSKEVPNDPSNGAGMLQYIIELEAFTQYATYVEARMTSTAVERAISKVIYFKTAAEVPSNPTNLKVIANMPGELYIRWDEPKKPNGNVTHYEVYWQLRNLDAAEYELRDYCVQPLISNSLEKLDDDETKKNESVDDFCCPMYCPKSEEAKLEEERERNYDIAFQDYLQNQVYIKRLDQGVTTIATKTRSTQRAMVSIGVQDLIKNSRSTPPLAGNTTLPAGVGTYTSDANSSIYSDVYNITNRDDTYLSTVTTAMPPIKTQVDNPYMKSDVYEVNEFVIPNLGHFQDYNIEVIACHSRPDDIVKEMLCSSQALAFGRTLPSPTADNVNSSTVHVTLLKNGTATSVHITWKDPPHPNGLILTYDIQYSKLEGDTVKSSNIICITYKMYRDQGKYGYVLMLESGDYTIQIRANSMAGNGSWTDRIAFTVPAKAMKEVMIWIICVSVAVLILVTVAVVIFTRRRYKKQLEAISNNPNYWLDKYPEYVYTPDEWEVNFDNVELIKELGHGSFGMVYEGVVNNLPGFNEPIKVAVKTTNAKSDDHDRMMFLQEASTMKQFKCHHVVRLIGVVSIRQPAYVLMELMPLGDLKNFLRQHRPEEEDNDGRIPPTLHQILQMAGEIADGMAYLADKKFVHRDLAARNCMVGEDMTVKIGDFGMTRDIYEMDYYRKGTRGLLPVRWMAPESLKDGVFTSSTDVWSYGVVLWEMATLAAQPYQGLSNEEVVKYVGSGQYMEMPEGCPERLYDLMRRCWQYRQKYRPTFKEIINMLVPDLNERFQIVSYFFSEENLKYEEAHHQSAMNDCNDLEQDISDFDTLDQDEAQEPMLGRQILNSHQSDVIFNDANMFSPHSSSHRQPMGSLEPGDDTLSQDFDDGAIALAHSRDFKRNTACVSPTSAMGGSSENSSASFAHMNGLSLANGHISARLQTSVC